MTRKKGDRGLRRKSLASPTHLSPRSSKRSSRSDHHQSDSGSPSRSRLFAKGSEDYQFDFPMSVSSSRASSPTMPHEASKDASPSKISHHDAAQYLSSLHLLATTTPKRSRSPSASSAKKGGHRSATKHRSSQPQQQSPVAPKQTGSLPYRDLKQSKVNRTVRNFIDKITTSPAVNVTRAVRSTLVEPAYRDEDLQIVLDIPERARERKAPSQSSSTSTHTHTYPSPSVSRPHAHSQSTTPNSQTTPSWQTPRRNFGLDEPLLSDSRASNLDMRSLTPRSSSPKPSSRARLSQTQGKADSRSTEKVHQQLREYHEANLLPFLSTTTYNKAHRASISEFIPSNASSQDQPLIPARRRHQLMDVAQNLAMDVGDEDVSDSIQSDLTKWIINRRRIREEATGPGLSFEWLGMKKRSELEDKVYRSMRDKEERHEKNARLHNDSHQPLSASISSKPPMMDIHSQPSLIEHSAASINRRIQLRNVRSNARQSFSEDSFLGRDRKYEVGHLQHHDHTHMPAESTDALALISQVLLQQQQPQQTSSQSSSRIENSRNRAVRTADAAAPLKRPPSSGITRHVLADSDNPYLEAVDVVEKFIRANKWRLHDLFSRIKKTDDDYRLPVDVICHNLELAGQLRQPTTEEKLFLVLLQSSEFVGDLRAVNPPVLKRFVCSCGMDSDGRVDYRAVVDDHKGVLELEHRLTLDKIRRKRNGEPPLSPETWHKLIAQSIAGDLRDPLQWLADAEEREQKQREQILAHLKVQKQRSKEQREEAEARSGAVENLAREEVIQEDTPKEEMNPPYIGLIPSYLQWNWQGQRRWNSSSTTFDTMNERIYRPLGTRPMSHRDKERERKAALHSTQGQHQRIAAPSQWRDAASDYEEDLSDYEVSLAAE